MATRSSGGVGSRGPKRGIQHLILFIAVTALVAGACWTSQPSTPPGSGSPQPSGAVATTAPQETGGSGPTSPAAVPSLTSPPTGEWASLQLPILAPVASLTPTKGSSDRVAADTAFRLKSLGNTSVAQLAARITAQPDLKLRAGTPSGDSVVLTPASPLRAGQPYRLTLRREDGSVAQSWTVTAATTLRIAGTLPSDAATGVPRDTGIEVTFDQGGVTAEAVRDHFSITPKVAGRFEVHGRTVAFVPSKSLAAKTLYTVTVTKGVPLAGTGQVLASDVRFQFETSGKAPKVDRVIVADRLQEAAVNVRATVYVRIEEGGDDDRVTVPKTLPLTVRRISGVDAAMNVYKRLAAAPEWTVFGGAPIPSTGLPLVLKANVPVREAADAYSVYWIRLPAGLPRGWYLLTLTQGGLRQQTLLQVTDTAAYTMVTDTKTVVWANSLANGRPIVGARVTIGGQSIGRTDAKGLTVATTPARARALGGPMAPTFVVIRDTKGRSMFVPVSDESVCGKCDIGSASDGAADAWWQVLTLDRVQLRQTDQVNAWGVIRARADGRLPKTLDVRLQTQSDDPASPGTTVVSERVTPTSSGVFSAELPFTDLPIGSYEVVVRADGKDVAANSVEIRPIIKPSYTLEVVTDRRAALIGSKVNATVTSRFYEGTPVAGMDLVLGASDESDPEAAPEASNARTGTDGTATLAMPVTLPSDDETTQWDWAQVNVRPWLPEEAAITGQTWVAAFRSDAILDTSASLDKRRLAVTGSVHDVDFARMATTPPGNPDANPRGAPRAGATIRLTFYELIPTRHKIGTTYDPIAKKVVTVYQYDTDRVSIGSATATTGRDGTFRLTKTVTGGDRSYEIEASYKSNVGSSIAANAYAYAEENAEPQEPFLRLVTTSVEPTFSVGDPVKIDFVGGHASAARDRYLFTVASRGLQVARVQSGPRFATTFRAAWIPNAEVSGVRFTGTGYDVDRYGANLSYATSDRRLAVTVTPDATRYEPGGSARLTVRTTSPSGKPVSASVAIRVIDEKLYTIDAAQSSDVLSSLYASVGSGVEAVAWSHGGVEQGGDGGGDTTGGGGDGPVRVDFRDWLLFRVISTDASGRATVDVDLSDDLTSWRASASAVDPSIRAGDGITELAVGRPFFADATLAPEYLVGDQPVLRVRGYGSALASGDRVTFTVSSTSLGMAPVTVTAKAFTSANVTLPKLPAGTQQVKVSATVQTSSGRLSDALVRTASVIPSRTTQSRTASALLTGATKPDGGGKSLTTLALSDGGRGRVLPVLLSAGGVPNGRADEAIAAVTSAAVLRDVFSMPDATSTSAASADISRYQLNDYYGAIALFPYADEDLELSVLGAVAGPPSIDQAGLHRYFGGVVENSDESAERRLIATVGLAATGEPNAADIRALAQNTKLTPTERSWLALGALEVGDEALAASLERSILAKNGQQDGPWVRVSLKNAEDTATTTALLAITAAGLGDPLAAKMDAYVEANPPKDTLVVLQRVLAARNWAERTPAAAAKALLRVDGSTRTIDIPAGETVWLTLTPTQLSSATLTPVSGSVVMTTRWDAPLQASSLTDRGITTFTRAVKPAGSVGVSDVVTVDYMVAIGDEKSGDCWAVTDMVPSGLAPISRSNLYDSEAPGYVGASSIIGQRVDFDVCRDPKQPVQRLHYIARVVTPGSYTWEPAVLQSQTIPEWGRTIPATQLRIGQE